MDEEKILKNFGLNLKLYRLKSKMSQDELSIKLGISSPYISNVESGKHNLSLVNAMKFAQFFDKSIEDMIKEI